MARGSGERDGLDDTVPASEPPTDVDGNPMRSSRASIPPSPLVQRYRLGAELGRGGMGRVVEAFDTQLGRTVALKEVLPKGPGVARRFVREIQITARLEHPAIVPLYDSGTTADGRAFYVMRRVTGRPLEELIKRAPNLAERLILLPAVLAAIDAVAHAHRRGVIHRDLKPANILVGELGETVVIDWGLAKVLGEEEDEGNAGANPTTVPTAADSLQTQVGSVFGTPGFMPPEQARGEELGTRGDVYALGATLYQLLAGAPPHTGTSATEVLGRTLKHDVEPLARTAPGAPPELVAIVDKALGFEAETRYADAGALGEDVRRFLAGQLVAAHRYTSRQRLGRFAKRHRGSLIIGAAAAVALAVLASVSVSRVMSERDTANRAQLAAEQDKQAAERARDRLAERNDAMIVTQARALVEVNPTEALATLKQLDPRSSRLADAKAVGQAAVMRGAWMAIRSTEEFTFITELSPDGRMLLQFSRDGGALLLRVWDLDLRKLVLARPYGLDYRALWIAGGKLLVHGENTVPEILDVATNQVTPTTLPAISYSIPDAAGTHVLMVDAKKAASLFDVASGEVRPLWLGHQVRDEAIAPDGSWVVLVDNQGLVVLDAAGKEIGARLGSVSRIGLSAHRQLAVIDNLRVLLSQVGSVAGPLVWTEVAAARTPNERPHDLAFRGPELNVYLANGDLLGYLTFPFTNRTGVRQFTYRLTEAGDHVMIVPSTDGKLYLTGDQLNLALSLPVPVPNLRIAARVGISRIAVTGTGVILIFDLDTVAPRRFPVPVGTQAVFVDDDTLLTWRNAGEDWEWIDLRTGKRTPFRFALDGIPSLIDIEPSTGRVLLSEDLGQEVRLSLLHKGAPGRVNLAKGNGNTWGRLIAGNAVVFGGGDGRVIAKVGDEAPREVVKLEGRAFAAVSLGNLTFAAIGDQGEVVRGNLANGAIERTNVTPGREVFIAGDLLGRVLIVEDNRLLLWDTDRVIDLHTFDRKIARVDPAEAGVMVTLADHELQLLDPAGTTAMRRLLGISTRAPRAQRGGRLVIGTGIGEKLVVLEVPSLARWEVPLLFSANDVINVAPSARRVVQGASNYLMVWDLPLAGADFPVWLDEQTNGIVRDDLLAWPWQATAPKP